MDKKKIRMLFNSCAAAVENVSDTKITQAGQLEEIGVCLADNALITYSEKEDAIKFYNGIDELLLTIDSTSPLLMMFQELVAIEKEYREEK